MPRFKYAAIGYVASKVVIPFAKRRIRRKARNSATGAARASARAVTDNPARTGLAAGSAVGAIGYLLMRRSRSADSQKTADKARSNSSK